MFNFANLGNVWASKEAYKGQPTSQLNSYRKNIYIKKYLQKENCNINRQAYNYKNNQQKKCNVNAPLQYLYLPLFNFYLYFLKAIFSHFSHF